MFRADPCLRFLEELEEDLKQKFQRMTVRGLHQKLKSTSYPPQDVRLITLGAYNARQTDAALPTAEVSSRQTLEAGETHQPAESAHTFSNGHSTTTESIGTSTGNLRHTSLAPSSEYTAPQSSFPGVKRHMKLTQRGRPYGIGDLKASSVHVQGAADEKPLDSSFAPLGAGPLGYAQRLALRPSPWGSRFGGEFVVSPSFASA